MSSTPDSARAAKLQNNPSLPFLLGCCCIGLIMLAAALTIVMALIPTYLPDAGDGLSRVNATNMEAYLAAKSASSGKRAVGSTAEDFEGCTFGGNSLDYLANTIGQYVKGKKVTGVTVNEVIIGWLDSSKRKRSLLSRNARASSTYIYMMRVFFEIADDCLYSCQLGVADELQSKLNSIPPSAFAFDNVPVYKNGIQQGTISSVRFGSFYPLTKLSPGKTKSRPGGRPGLRTPSSMTTAPAMSMTTPMSG